MIERIIRRNLRRRRVTGGVLGHKRDGPKGSDQDSSNRQRDFDRTFGERGDRGTTVENSENDTV